MVLQKEMESEMGYSVKIRKWHVRDEAVGWIWVGERAISASRGWIRGRPADQFGRSVKAVKNVPFYLVLSRQTYLLFCAISLLWASWSLYGGIGLLVAE
jgi:hypothetical protein